MDNTPGHALGNGGRVRCSCCTVGSVVRYNLEVNPLGLSNYTAKSEVEENAHERERTRVKASVSGNTIFKITSGSVDGKF